VAKDESGAELFRRLGLRRLDTLTAVDLSEYVRTIRNKVFVGGFSIRDGGDALFIETHYKAAMYKLEKIIQEAR